MKHNLHPRNSDVVCEPGLVLLGLLAKIVPIRKSVLSILEEAKKKVESFGPLADILNNSKEPRVQRAALKSLYRLSFCERARKAICMFSFTITFANPP